MPELNKKPPYERRFFEAEKLDMREGEGTESRTVSGYAAVFNRFSAPMYFGGEQVKEQIAKGAFTQSLQDRDILALWSHNWDLPLGRSSENQLRLKEDDAGLGFELDLPDTTIGRDALYNIRNKIVKGMSFGFIVTGEGWEKESESVYIRTITKVDLYEVSPTALPAYPQTSVRAQEFQAVFNGLEEFKSSQKPEEINSKTEERYWARRFKLALLGV